MKDKWEEVEARMARLGVFDHDLTEKFILGSGSGGQKINKTSSCVYLKHIPSRIEIKCQKTRSRELNRLYARRELCERLEGLLLEEKSKKQQEMEKVRRQKRRRSRKAKQKMIEGKRLQSSKKELRRPPSE